MTEQMKHAISCVLEDADHNAPVGYYGSIDWQLGEITRIVDEAFANALTTACAFGEILDLVGLQIVAKE